MKLLIILVLVTTVLPNTFGKEATILSLEKCDSPLKLDLDWTLTEVEDEQFLTFTANIADLIDMNEIKYNVKIYNQIDEEDEYNKVAEVDGPLCQLLTQFLGPEWDRARATFDPPIDTSCIVQPGTYELVDFKLIPNNIALPPKAFATLFRSKAQIKVEVDVYDDEDKLGCGVLELLVE